jgi:TrmH family RNA methyltransferase
MITSTDNRQVKQLVLLQNKARERKRQGVFVAEGKKMFAEAPRAWVESVYVSESFLSEEDAKALLSGTTYEVLSDSVFRHVSDTQTPQGILCVLRKPVYALSDLLAGDATHLLLLEGIQDPGNLGTMIRTGEGAGITGVILDENTADLFNPKTIRSTMGSIYRVPYYISADLHADIAALKREGVRLYAAHLAGKVAYDEPDYTSPCAFLIGNEGNGLTDETASLADTYIRIPMAGAVESLNAAVSASLLMYETARQRRKKI